MDDTASSFKINLKELTVATTDTQSPLPPPHPPQKKKTNTVEARLDHF